jgi:tRNA dimethylallyltransferase
MSQIVAPKTIVVIAGPTAVGKTAIAIAVAKWLGTAIISCDSRQCYKELDIGVARPTTAELAQVQHYFIASHSIQQTVNAVVFENYALQIAHQILQQQNYAVMVGGTGLYLKAFCEGLDDIPKIDAAIRQSITHQYQQHGMAWLQQQVLQQDPTFYANGEVQNPQRLMRALEVKLGTGYSIDHFRNGEKKQRPFNIIKIGLELPRQQLYDRINSRAEQMVANGLLDEVSSLLPYKHYNALQTVGYKEMFEVLQQQCSMATAVERLKQNTRHYAKRQLTWFKKDSSITWCAPQFDAVKKQLQNWIATQ